MHGHSLARELDGLFALAPQPNLDAGPALTPPPRWGGGLGARARPRRPRAIRRELPCPLLAGALTGRKRAGRRGHRCNLARPRPLWKDWRVGRVRASGTLEERLEEELGGSRALIGVLDALADAVTIRATDDRLIYANRAALERIGLDSVEDLRAADPRELMGGWITTGEDGGPIAMDDLPSVRLLRGLHPDPLILRTVHRESGEERWVVLKATAIKDGGDAIRAAVTIIEDVTSDKRASLRTEFLAEAAR